MSNIVPQSDSAAAVAALLERVVLQGDLSKLAPEERLRYYREVCESVGLNPLTQPFEYITLNGKLKLYARKDATDQLRRQHSVSIAIRSRECVNDVYVVTAQAVLPSGRTDESIGAVPLSGLKGDTLANAYMRAETKAKRRVTLSICGLGLLDETEVEAIPDTRRQQLPPAKGKSLPSDGAELEAKLVKWEKSLVDAGRCKQGQLMSAIYRAYMVDFNVPSEAIPPFPQWGRVAIELAVRIARRFDKEHLKPDNAAPPVGASNPSPAVNGTAMPDKISLEQASGLNELLARKGRKWSLVRELWDLPAGALPADLTPQQHAEIVKRLNEEKDVAAAKK